MVELLQEEDIGRLDENIDRLDIEELRDVARQLLRRHRSDQDTIRSLRVPLLSQLSADNAVSQDDQFDEAGLGSDVSPEQAAREAAERAMSVQAKLEESIAELEEQDEGWDLMQNDDDWSGRDACLAGSCIFFNLLLGIAMAALAAGLLLSQPSGSPCRAWAEGRGVDIGGCVSVLATSLAQREPPPLSPEVCAKTSNVLGLWVGKLLQSASLCANGAGSSEVPPSLTEQDPIRGPALLSMDVKRGGFVLLGHRFWGKSSPLSIWDNEDPSAVAEAWLSRSGARAEGVQRTAVVRLITDAARNTGVVGRLKPLTSLPIELNDEIVPLAIFEGDDPEKTAQWYVAELNKAQSGASPPLGLADVKMVSNAVHDVLFATPWKPGGSPQDAAAAGEVQLDDDDRLLLHDIYE